MMLLYVTGPERCEEGRARALYADLAGRWGEACARRRHPRSDAALVPAITRFDLFLGAFSPGTASESGLPVHLPPAEQWWSWVPRMRRSLKTLIRSTFPVGERFGVPYAPVGPAMTQPSPETAQPLHTLVGELTDAADPAQQPVDPRLWLVLAPPLPAELEEMFLASFLRAEAYARRARMPAGLDEPGAWLDGEVDALVAGRGLVTEGLVTDLTRPRESNLGDGPSRSEPFDLLAGLQDMYATREVLAPGELYNRFHSHTGSEELYIVLEGRGTIRVNERLLPIAAGQCFGKPRGYDCATQILNTGDQPMVFLDIGTDGQEEVDLCRYPEQGELMARFAGHRWWVPTDAIRPGAELFPVYDRRYFRGPAPGKP